MQALCDLVPVYITSLLSNMAGVRTLLLWAVVTECWILFILGSCPAGKFGDSCSYSCHCGQSCNQTTGICGGGCDKGWVGGHGGSCQKENIAYKKRATSSGIYKSGWTADKAVDGNWDQEVNHNSCYHSSKPPSVWTVDLGQQYRIHDVKIYNRDGYVDLIRSAVLSLSNSSSSTSGVPCYTFPSNTIKGNSVYDVICDGRGRYFTITHWTDLLNICEVEIYECSNGTYGQNCSKRCTDRNCAGNSPCDHVTGSCVPGCKVGWMGTDCVEECDQDHYGLNCNDKCGNRNCATDTSSCDRRTGSCVTGCLPGWTKVDCTQECSSRTYGQNCSKRCTDRNCAGNSPCDHVTGSCVHGCKSGWMGIDCVEECDQDHYGLNCNDKCGNRNCATDTSSCDRRTGSCVTGCLPGWTKVDCTQECSSRTYGQNCSKRCTDRNCAGNSSCDHVTGSCVHGCKSGWMGIDCVEECDEDHYGVNCNGTCGNRNCATEKSSCDRRTGSCDTGCLPGWTKVDCKEECSRGTYGQNCSKQCTERNCAGNSSCDHVTGSCVPGCKTGWMGIDCVEACEHDLYGPNCTKTCASRHCMGNSSCNSTGGCDTGCEERWTGTDCTACDSQRYGSNCTKNCTSRHCAGDSSCNSKGDCDSGCQTGWMESDCTAEVFQEAVSSDPTISIPTYAGVVGVVLVGLVLVLIFVFIRRRKLSKRKHGDAELVSKTVQSSQDEGNVYMNVGRNEEKQSAIASKKRLTQVQPESPQEEEKEEEEEEEPEEEEKKKEEPEEEEQEETYDTTTQREEAAEIPDRNYYNLEEAGIGRVIPISTLQARAQEFEETPELAEDEFKRLPDGFIHPYVESQMPKNNGKNRFKGYFPYDYNRVLLQDGDGGGDYINASYVDGYKKDKRYIAAQGPYNNQVVVDFWRMIWEKECRTVVMVTGLVEAGKVKCLRYWPEKGTKKYGDVMVTMVSETRLSNYTFTNLSVENAKERKKWDVSHLHFTSWPDHGVPDTAALLDFMWRVKVISGQQTQPIIVHCRHITTFSSFELLERIQETITAILTSPFSAGIGRTGTYIAVENLVEQAKAEDVVDVVSFVSNMRGQRKNMIQTKEQYMFVYHAVARAVTDGDTSVDVDDIRQMDLGCVSDITFGNRTVRQHLEALRNVQRGNPESFGVRCVHSYTKSNGFFIMTSHPDKEDVWNQVYNSDSNSLITFAVGDLTYLPSVDHPITTKSFAVNMRRSAVLSNGILMNTIDINLLDCDDTTCIQHYHIAGSARDPNINLMIDSFLTWTSDPQRSSSTIISDSLTDCRLLVLLVNIASRLQDDGRVDVINNMRQLYTRLGGPPYTEADVSFCLESVQRQLESSNVYVNF
ncbi:uncharacterized protein LOC124287019 [Haliotis rubra]|uniref:uncharacterized protein LOC124287019 n=1 Tax=Haliotis rubra TaxID=36100 RepID=UPI001EE55C29|nr:uncharacterized protein LOC124287019 [Haliotis rubra]